MKSHVFERSGLNEFGYRCAASSDGRYIAAIISIICCLLFKPARVKAYDDKYRAAAGKPLDDVLVGRK